MTAEIETHRRSLMAHGQKFTFGDVVRLKFDFLNYREGDLLTVVQTALQAQGKAHAQQFLKVATNDQFINSYSCYGKHGGVAWLSLDDIEKAE